jgi:hypothetical protein
MQDIGTGCRAVRFTQLNELRPFQCGELTNGNQHALHINLDAAKFG